MTDAPTRYHHDKQQNPNSYCQICNVTSSTGHQANAMPIALHATNATGDTNRQFAVYLGTPSTGRANKDNSKYEDTEY